MAKERRRDIAAIPLWETARARLEEGDELSPDELECLIRAEGVPPDMGDYVADRLRPVRGRGRPRETRTGRAERQQRAVEVKTEVVRYQAGFGLMGKSRPKERAIERVAAQRHLSVETVRDMVRRGLSGEARAADMVPSLSEAKEWLEEMLTDGAVRLDPELGVVDLGPTEVDPILVVERDENGRIVTRRRPPGTYGPRKS